MKTAKRIIPLILVFALIFSIGIGDGLALISKAEATANMPMIGNTKSVKTSTGVFLQSYVAVESGVATNVSFYAAKKLDVYAFESTTGGDVLSKKSDERETSMGGADSDNHYITYTTDPTAIPYQAFEVDVSDVKGEIFFGFEGTVPNVNGILVMYVYNPSTESYFETSRDTFHNGTITLTYTADAQKYAENGRVRYRIAFPSGTTENKKIIMHSAAAGYVDKTVQYGTTKKKTASGNVSLNYKASDENDVYFCVEADSANGRAYSLPIYLFPHNNDTNQDQLHHFNVNFNADTKTCRNMTWSTVTDMPTVVQVIPYGPIEQDFANATEYEGTVEFYDDYIDKYSFEVNKKYSHYVTVDGLEAGHEYWYRYGNGTDVWSTPCYLRTDDGDNSFSFVIGGDPQPEASAAKTQEEIAVMYGERYKEMAYSCNEAERLTGAEFVVCTGDESDAGWLERCWDWYFSSNAEVFNTKTLAVTMGNHDFRYSDWVDKFAFPYSLRKHNYEDPLGEYDRGWFYSFDYGNVHFSVINGNIAKANNSSRIPEPYKDIDFEVLRDKMLKWLDDDLENSTADFNIVVCHQGMYSYPCHTYDTETKELRALLVPIVDKHEVDIFFQGHDHVWIRTNTMQGGDEVASDSGTVYDPESGDTYRIDPVGTVYTNCGSFTGSKYHDPNPVPFANLIPVAVASQPEYPTFSTVEVENGKLSLKGWARTETGECKRISEFTCYSSGTPESDGYSIINSAFYTKVVNRIDALPETISLDNQEEIIYLTKTCDLESDAIISAMIPNYAKLEDAKQQLDELTAEVIVPGDVDGDEDVTVTDALIVLRVAAKLSQETPELLKIADMDGDEKITVTDALLVLRIAAKLV